MYRHKNTRGRQNTAPAYGYYARTMFPTNALNSPATHRDIDYNNTEGYSAIFFAVHQGDLIRAHKLLKEDYIENEFQGRTLMHVAAARGQEQILCLLQQRNARIDKGDRDGNSPLHLAIKANHIDLIHQLVKENTVNLKNSLTKTPLHIAIENNQSEIVEILLKNGANPNEPNLTGDTPLHAAVTMRRPNLKIITLLMDHEANENLLSDALFTPLYLAVASGHISVVKILVKYNAQIDMNNKGEISPLVLAIQKNNTEIVRQLLTSKYRESTEMTCIMTPLHYAAKYGKLEIVKLLVTNGYNKVNAENEVFQTPLYFAVFNGHLEVVKYFMEIGSKIELTTLDGESLLHLCAKKGRIEILKYLIDRGALIDKKTHEDETPLHYAISNDHLNIVKYLLECGANIHLVTLHNETSLHLAVKACNEKIVEELFKYGASISPLANSLCSALTCAVKSRNKKIVQLFIANDFKDFETDTKDNERALHVAARNGDEEILKLLLDAGCSLNIICKEKKPIHVAAIYGHVKLIQLLIERGADVNSTNRFKETPLHFAAASGRVAAVQFLLNAGADPHLLTDRSLSAIEYALDRKRHTSIMQKRSTTSTNIEHSDAAWFVQSYMFEKYLDITEMILIKRKLKLIFFHPFSEPIDPNWFHLASQIRVLKQQNSAIESKPKENTANVKFRPEIIQCILNYTNKSFDDHLKSAFSIAVDHNSPELLKCLLEYDIDKLIYNNKMNWLQCDTKFIVTIIDHIEDLNKIYNLLYSSEMQRDVIRLQEARNPLVAPLRTRPELGINFDRLGGVLLMLDINILKSFVARLVQLRSISKKETGNSFLESKELEILKNYNLSEWYSQCEIQIMNARESKIHPNFDVTYYDILSQPVAKIANYVRQKELLKILNLSCMKFPAYCEFFKISIEKGEQRKDLIDACANCLLKFVENNHKIQLPIIVIDKIFKNLSVIDLRKLQQAGRFIDKPLQSRNYSAERRNRKVENKK